jgi:hypothetical protein
VTGQTDTEATKSPIREEISYGAHAVGASCESVDEKDACRALPEGEFLGSFENFQLLHAHLRVSALDRFSIIGVT